MVTKAFPVVIKVYKCIKEDYYNITIPNNIYSNLDKNDKIKLKVGAANIDVNYFENNTENSIMISAPLAEELGLYDNMNINLKVEQNIISLGPVIGTFTDLTSIRIANKQRAGNKMTWLSVANKEAKTILYFFSIEDLREENQRINGTYYNYDTKRWEQRLFPFPDILYDRGGSSLKGHKALSRSIRETIEANDNVKRFNPRYYFDKWDTYRELKKYEKVVSYLPKTIRYRDKEDLLKIFELSDTLYVKDRTGNRGLGVTRVIKHSDGTFELSYFKKELFKYDFNSFEELASKIDEIYMNKKAIVQSAIDVIKIKNGSVDMRATVQRNGDGELQITAYPVRVGKAGAPITSTRSGSEVYTFEGFFKKFFNYSDKHIGKLMEKVDKFLFTTYRAIEKTYGTFGEIGIDFAIDNEENVWFIECNAKPGKDTVYLSYDEDTVKKAFLNPLEYSKYISEF